MARIEHDNELEKRDVLPISRIFDLMTGVGA
jgi:hypothetical protein